MVVAIRRLVQALREVLDPAAMIAEPAAEHAMLVDERGLYQGRAAAIVLPSSTHELARAVRLCSDAGVAMVPQGGNTGYCGGATPDRSGTQVLFNLSRMNRIIDLDAQSHTLTAQSGVVLAAAQNAAAEHDLLLPLSMGSEGSCQLGGNVSTNAGGVAVLRYGTAKELVAGLEVVLPDGQIWSDLKGLRKDNTGYDLKQLFMGAEGTLGIISTVVMRLQPRPRARIAAWLEVDDLACAVATLAHLRRCVGDCITSFEFISKEALALVLEQLEGTRDPFGESINDHALIEVVAFDDAALRMQSLLEALEGAMEDRILANAVVAQSESQRQAFWHLRESIPVAEKLAGGSVKHDVSVEIASLGEFVHETLVAILRAFPGCRPSVYGHVGDGNVHFNVLAPATGAAEVFKRDYAADVSALVHDMTIRRGGSFSAEHGIGQLKRELLAQSANPVGLDLMHQIKKAIDPKGLMNPGKVLARLPLQ